MTIRQVYATVVEMISDLGLAGDASLRNAGQQGNALLDYIRMASQEMANYMGDFLPVTETRKYGKGGRGMESPSAQRKRELELGNLGTEGDILMVDALLTVTSITSDATAVTDYTLYPLNKAWRNGPYTRIVSNDGNWADEDDVEVAGQWGKWLEYEALGVSAVTQLVGDATLVVNDGSKLSAGMVLLVEAEQEYVSGWGATTAAMSKLNGSVAADDEEITVDNGAEFNAGEVIRIGTEDFYLLAVNGHVWACARGWNGTTKAAHADDKAIAVYRTGTVERGVNGTTAAAHTSKTVYRMRVPWDVNWLCRQMAGLMRMKAMTSFSGRGGNAATGESFWINEFPKGQMETVKRNYELY
jgi:hypothetical protein